MTPIHIIVGSQMGAAEYVADELTAKLESLGFEVQLHENPEYEAIPKQQCSWLICTSTHGAGELPDNIQPFIAELKAQRPDLDSICYGIIGLGDRSYDTFCAAAHLIDDILTDLNAQKRAELLEIDALDQQLPEDLALQWLPSWLEAL